MKTNTESTLLDCLEASCHKYADRPAFTCLGHTLSYAGLDARARCVAAFLQRELKLQAGDRIAIQLPNCLQYPVMVLAALRAGLVIVNTNPLYTPREMLHQFTDAGVKALVVLEDFTDKVAAVIDGTDIQHVIVTDMGDMHPLPRRWLVNAVMAWRRGSGRRWRDRRAVRFSAALAAKPEPLPVAAPDPEDLVMLQYTGGTTGIAKGAMLTHAGMVADFRQLSELLRGSAEDGREIIVMPLPLYHIFAFATCMVLATCRGYHSLLIPNPRDVPGMVRAIARVPFTLFVGLNTLFNALCRNRDFRKLRFDTLKLTLSGGMALTTDVAQQWLSVTGCRIVEGYGLTETSCVVTANPLHAPRIGSIGKPVVDTELRVEGEDGNPAPAGEAGELLVRGPQLMKGYWNRPEDTAEVITDDGFFRTGDIATVDEDGYFHIVDRKKDMILVSGFNVYPNDIENAISSHPDIVECAAIGVPDDNSGEAVKLFAVRANPSLTEADVRSYARQQLTAYKVPRDIEFTDELPKSNVGKVLRRELREAELKRAGRART